MIAMALGLGVAGCGDDGDDIGLEDVGENEDDTTTTAGGDPTTTTVGSEAPQSDDPNCQQLIDIATSLASTSDGESEEPVLLDFGVFADAIGSLLEDATPEEAAAIQPAVDAYRAADDALGGEPLDVSDPAAIQSEGFAELQQALNTPEGQEAGEALSTFLSERCGEFPEPE